jgi:hypothetical protein
MEKPYVDIRNNSTSRPHGDAIVHLQLGRAAHCDRLPFRRASSPEPFPAAAAPERVRADIADERKREHSGQGQLVR